MTRIENHTLDAPGATIAYDVRGDVTSAGPDNPVLLLIGSPMDASGFGTLASHFTDRVVATYDPRGAARSTKTDPSQPSTPEQHADDLHRVVDALGTGPVDLFASSGGAVNALALLTAHPEDVRTVVAHEPPLARLVNDHEVVEAVCRDIQATYQSSGMGAAMAKFIKVVMFRGELPADYVQGPAPDPAMFGLPCSDDGAREDVLLGQNLLTSTLYEPDLAALCASTDKLVVAAGVESEGELAHRGGQALAARLGVEAVSFPSGHAGFLGGEFGQTGAPEAFAARLREVLAR